MSDRESDDDDWYNQMDQMAQGYGDAADGLGQDPNAAMLSGMVTEEAEVSEDQYFSMMSENNTSISDNCFLSEGNMVWQGLARKFLTESTDRVSQQASRLQRVFPAADSCTFLLLQQWFFTFLPYSLKSYAILMNPTLLNSQQRCFYLDNKLHPSMWAATNYNRASHSIEIIIFAPYKTYQPCKKLCYDLVQEIQQNHPGVKMKLTGVDAELFESVILPFSQQSNHLLNVLWIESCTMHVFESKWNIQPIELIEGYEFRALG